MFHIQIPLPTPQDAFEMLVSNIRRLDWFIAHNRSNRLDFFLNYPHPIIHEMVQNRHLSQSDFTLKYQDDFSKKLYDEKRYIPFMKLISDELSVVQACYPKLKRLQESWGFEILSHYQIDLDIFGIGGRYFRDEENTGHILLGTGSGLKEKAFISHTIVHEMIHLGIEDLIINPNKLKTPPIYQEEKERIVDNLCSYATKKAIPNYQRKWSNGSFSRFQEIAQHCAYMDKVVGKQPQKNLVKSIQQFLKENNR